MAAKKVATMNLRIEPSVKDAVRKAASKERRSMANFIEYLIVNYCDQVGITITNKDDALEGVL